MSHHHTLTTPRVDELWQVELFTNPLPLTVDPHTISPRSAYQDALYDRALLLDVRSSSERLRDGRLPADLPVIEVRPGVDLDALSLVERVYLIGGDGQAVEPADLAGFERDDPAMATVTGGFAAWLAAGLPIAR